jgi:hypothetical protein
MTTLAIVALLIASHAIAFCLGRHGRRDDAITLEEARARRILHTTERKK